MEASFKCTETRTRKIPKKTNSTNSSLFTKFIVRQIDKCHEREIWFVVTDKCAIYLLIEITWLS